MADEAAASTHSALPLVTLGLPVYNGERYLRQAIDSILGQTFRDFRLVISDNASTDGTAAIAAAAAASDPRVTVIRQPTNIGASPNFNALFENVRSRYFKWCAHDDVLAPSFLERCVETLEATPEAVLCHATTQFIDAEGKVVGEAPALPRGLEDDSASTRFAGFILTQRSCFEIFGLIRTEALTPTQLHLAFGGSDRALLTELALQGRFVAIAEPLFQNRLHAERFSEAVRQDPAATLAWYDPSQARVPVRHNWTLYRHYWTYVGRYTRSPGERLRCWLALLRWAARPINAKGLARDFLKMLPTPVANTLRAGKRRLVG